MRVAAQATAPSGRGAKLPSERARRHRAGKDAAAAAEASPQAVVARDWLIRRRLRLISDR